MKRNDEEILHSLLFHNIYVLFPRGTKDFWKKNIINEEMLD